MVTIIKKLAPAREAEYTPAWMLTVALNDADSLRRSERFIGYGRMAQVETDLAWNEFPRARSSRPAEEAMKAFALEWCGDPSQ